MNFAPEDAIAKVLEKQFEVKLNNERENLSKQYSAQLLDFEKQQKEFEEKKKKKMNYSQSDYKKND